MNQRFTSIKKWVAAPLLAMLAALLITSLVFAAAPAQTGAVALENYLKREQIALNDQGVRLQNANQVISATQSWINSLKTAGKDTSALESALSTYQSQVAAAQSDHDAAATILASPAGFDGSGKVTDLKAALQTVLDAGKHLRQAHLTLTQGTIEFRNAVNAWRSVNK